MWRFFKAQKNLNLDSDLALIETYKESKNPECIGKLYERYAQLVFAVCMKYLKNEEDSKDAVSRIFEKLFDDLKKYEIKQFNHWIHRVARNYCYSELQKQKIVTNNIINTETYEISNDEENEKVNYSDEQLQLAINSLDESQRICIELFYLHNKRYTMIAELTDYSILQVKSYLQNGKRNLKNYLIKSDERARNKR
jgi:RNA polymerase sigma-70 factor (ECF subfamily)